MMFPKVDIVGTIILIKTMISHTHTHTVESHKKQTEALMSEKKLFFSSGLFK